MLQHVDVDDVVMVPTPCVDIVFPTPCADNVAVPTPYVVNVDIVEVTKLIVDDDHVSTFFMLMMMMMSQHLYVGNVDDDLALQMIWFLILTC